jgi:glycosidase
MTITTMLRSLLFFFVVGSFFSETFAQVTTVPSIPSIQQPVTIVFNAAQGNAGLINYTGKVYIHTGVITDASSRPSDWKCVVTNWGQDIDTINLMTRDVQNPNIYRLTIPDIRAYYNKGTNCLGSSKILKLAMVFRNEGPSPTREGKGPGNSDIFVDVAQEADNVKITLPVGSGFYPAFTRQNTAVTIQAVAQSNATVTQLQLSVNGTSVASTQNDTLVHAYTPTQAGKHTLVATANFSNQVVKRDTLLLYTYPASSNTPVPTGMKDGINIDPNDPTKATLVLFAPKKEFVYLLTETNDYKPDPAFFMHRHEINPDSVRFWYTWAGLTPGQEYGFQYLVEGKIRVTDPYVEKILDPVDDAFIPSTVYPNLKAYPSSKTEYQVGILQTQKPAYAWQVTNFTPPPKEKLVIYELLVRDFVGARSYQTLVDTLSYLQRLGVNAIELMPVNEFDGNSSWGYNPSFHLALDKYYGTQQAFKRFIDECHKRGIAVILDIVLNQATGQSPLVRLYNGGGYSDVVAGNPWFNTKAPHAVLSFFNDFNHDAPATKYFTRRVIEHWIKEYKIDGFRFDLSKGFTQTQTNSYEAWARPDAGRIRLWKEIADYIWAIDPDFYVILEHFADNTEEQVLSDYGMMLWGNLNYPFNEATMGYNANSNFGSLSYKNRQWTKPHLIGYMESHDEERLMYKNLTFGSSLGSQNVKDPKVALERTKAAAAFLLLTPGPKMIWQFGELGYPYSINRCTNGSISDDCRLSEKPLPWNQQYLQADNRRLYQVFSELIKLKTGQEAFSTTDFTLEAAGETKRLILRHPSMNAVVIGNFSVLTSSVVPNFPSTGTWFDFFRSSSVTITNPTAPISLLPGEFRIYTSIPIPGNRRGMVSTSLDEPSLDQPQSFALLPAYPNPFNPRTQLRFQLPASARVEIAIYDVLGRKVAEALPPTLYTAGLHQIEFNAASLASGTYLVRMMANGQTRTGKIQVIQ